MTQLKQKKGSVSDILGQDWKKSGEFSDDISLHTLSIKENGRSRCSKLNLLWYDKNEDLGLCVPVLLHIMPTLFSSFALKVENVK